MNTQVTEGSIAQMLQPKREALIKMIGEDRLQRELSFAIQAANANDYVMQCVQESPQSLAKAIFNVALCDLSLNPVTKLAYLIPKRIGQQNQVILMPSYQGLVKLICDKGGVRTIYAHCAYDGDIFEPEYGTQVNIKHIPKGLTKADENIVAVYAVAILTSGEKMVELMWRNEVDEIRDLSDGYKAFKNGKAKSSIWHDWYGEMARKTVIKRLYKYIPKTSNHAIISEAIELDNQEYQISVGQMGMLESLIKGASITEQEKELLEGQLPYMTFHEAQSHIERLRNNQLDPVTHGLNPTQAQINEHIKTITQ